MMKSDEALTALLIAVQTSTRERSLSHETVLLRFEALLAVQLQS